MPKNYGSALWEIVAGRKGVVLLIPFLSTVMLFWQAKSSEPILENVDTPYIVAGFAIVMFLVAWLNGGRLVAMAKAEVESARSATDRAERTLSAVQDKCFEQVRAHAESLRLLKVTQDALKASQADLEHAKRLAEPDLAPIGVSAKAMRHLLGETKRLLEGLPPQEASDDTFHRWGYAASHLSIEIDNVGRSEHLPLGVRNRYLVTSNRERRPIPGYLLCDNRETARKKFVDLCTSEVVLEEGAIAAESYLEEHACARLS